MVVIKTDDPYERLAGAIILQAVSDYRTALKDGSDEIRALEKFFRSDYFMLLTSIDGEMLISRLKKEAGH